MNMSELPDIPESALIQIPVLENQFAVINYVYLKDGYFAPVSGGEKKLDQDCMTAILADRLEIAPMNGNGNGNTPIGGLFQEIPLFFFNETGWLQSSNGFYFVDPYAMRGKIHGRKYLIAVNPDNKMYLWQDGRVEFLIKENHTFHSGIETVEMQDQEFIDMGPYYLMRTMLDGILSDKKLHDSLTDGD